MVTLSEFITTAAASRRVTVSAQRHDGGFATASRPQKFTCTDGNLYVVKFIQNNHGSGRGTFNEQVVALCGTLVGAPVATVELVYVSDPIAQQLDQDRAALNIDFSPKAGVHHGSRWVDNYSDRAGLQYFDDNRQRFGALDVLYTWLGCAGDEQWIYANDQTRHVLSVDHTTFLPGGPAWTTTTLAASRSSPQQNAQLATLALQPADRDQALRRLGLVSERDIAAVVARPPDDWGVAPDERAALGEYLVTRQAAVLAMY